MSPKYMIHSCNKRLWYVNNFLIPSMVEQGIPRKDIILWNDYSGAGNLKMFIASMEAVARLLPESESVWHLQDDVMISSDFKKVTETAPVDKICNGICMVDKKYFSCIGLQPMENRWLSFQCIQIPNRYAKAFVEWWGNHVIKNNLYAARRKANKYDDYLFWEFAKQKFPNEKILNIVPNIVQHIDYMIGGSLLQADWHIKSRIGTAEYWIETDREKQLESEIREYLEEKHGKTENRNR